MNCERCKSLEEGFREVNALANNEGEQPGFSLKVQRIIQALLAPKAAPASACICEDYEEGGKVFNPNCPEAAEHKAPAKCEHDKIRSEAHHEVLRALVEHAEGRLMSYRYFLYDRLGYPTGAAYSDFFYFFNLFQEIGALKISPSQGPAPKEVSHE